MVALNPKPKQFSQGSPLDYADLNLIILALEKLATQVPEIVAPAAGSETPSAGSTVTTISRTFEIPSAPPLGTTNSKGAQTFVTFPVTFSSAPQVLVSPIVKDAQNGIPVLSVVDSVQVNGFTVRGGFVGRSSTAGTAIARGRYIAIGTVVSSNSSNADSASSSTGSGLNNGIFE